MSRKTALKIARFTLIMAVLIAFVSLLKYPFKHQAGTAARMQHSGQIKTAQPRYLYSIKVRNEGLQAIAFRQGKLVVAYKGLNTVDLYSPDGRYVGSFPVAPDTRINPVSMSQDRFGNLYLCDMANRVVLFFDKGNNFLYPFPPRKITPSDIDFIHAPGDVFVNKANVFVIDVGENSVKVFTEGGEFLMSIKDWGSGEKFLLPAAVMQTADGRILVADTLKRKVAVFNCAGKFAYFFEDPKEGTLGQPVAIAADSRGKVHVLDAVKEKVFVYDNFGRYLFSYGSSFLGIRKMRMPVDIVTDTEGKRIFIADSGNQEVDVWGE